MKSVAPGVEVVFWDECEETDISYYNKMEELYNFVVDNKINIITSSVGISRKNKEDYIKKMYDNGIIWLNSAGNNTQDVKPTSNRVSAIGEEVYGIGAYELNELGNMKLANFSNYGETIDLISPSGVPIDNYLYDGILDKTFVGTSCATPFTAGMVSLIQEINPKINSKNLDDYILEKGKMFSCDKGNYLYLVLNYEDIVNFHNQDEDIVVNNYIETSISPYRDNNYRISQEYSSSHTGIDMVYNDSENNYIYSVAGGVIDYLGWENNNDHSQGFGQYVRIKGNDGLFYYYGHLNWISENLKLNDKVSQGDLLGREGNTGKSTGRHLHFEIRKKVGVIKDMNDSINPHTILDKKEEESELHKALVLINNNFRLKNLAECNIEYWEKQISNIKWLDELFIRISKSL